MVDFRSADCIKGVTFFMPGSFAMVSTPDRCGGFRCVFAAAETTHILFKFSLEFLMVAGSTVRTIHRIAGEEKWPEGRLMTAILGAQASVDPSLWIRSVDLALVGGDPLTLCARLDAVCAGYAPGKGPRVAVLHSGEFSGAPLAMLEDERIAKAFGAQGAEANVEAYVGTRCAAAARKASIVCAGGVVAFCHLQGARDDVRKEIVLRLSRGKDTLRKGGIGNPATSRLEGQNDMFARSAWLERTALSQAMSTLSETFSTPKAGKRFADVVVAKRVEILSGSVGNAEAKTAEFGLSIADRVGGLARGFPRTAAAALYLWSLDFGAVRGEPISSEIKEIYR